MVIRNQTWTQGGVESGVKVLDEIVPIPPEELVKQARRERLRTFSTQPQTLGTVLAAVSDLIRELELDI